MNGISILKMWKLRLPWYSNGCFPLILHLKLLFFVFNFFGIGIFFFFFCFIRFRMKMLYPKLPREGVQVPCLLLMDKRSNQNCTPLLRPHIKYFIIISIFFGSVCLVLGHFFFPTRSLLGGSWWSSFHRKIMIWSWISQFLLQLLNQQQILPSMLLVIWHSFFFKIFYLFCSSIGSYKNIVYHACAK